MRILEAFNTENFQSDGKLRIGTNFFLFYFYIVVFPVVVIECVYEKKIGKK